LVSRQKKLRLVHNDILYEQDVWRENNKKTVIAATTIFLQQDTDNDIQIKMHDYTKFP